MSQPYSEHMLGATVLIVEDDPELRGLLIRGLREDGFEVEAVSTGAQALERVEHVRPDVLVVDIGLPDTDGRDLCQAIRARGIQTPVLFLTARDALVDRVAGFDAGGVDVPLTPTEFRILAKLLARPGDAVRRRDLVRAGWPHGAIVRDNTLDAYVARLRKKLRELADAPELSTVHGVGYRLQ